MKYESSFDLDDPQRTIEHAEIIKSKPFLKKLYKDWYSNFEKVVPQLPAGKMIEIGSGGGFLKEIMPEVITSDILPLPGCDMCFSAEHLPFQNDELSAIFMVNVLHHIPDVKKFFSEAESKLKKGGMIVMVETAHTPFSKFIYRNYHHEPFEPGVADWKLPEGGPMSISNQAMPWIIFDRDKKIFESLYPRLKIESIKYHTPFRYILSGGVSRKAFVPDWTFGLFTAFEKVLSPFSKLSSLFFTIVLKKQ
jgi:SAM-dependent methyltransferase